MDWSTFTRDRIRAAFLLPPGVEMPPLVVEPIEDIGVAEVDEDVGTPLEHPSDSGRLDRRLSRRFTSFRSPKSEVEGTSHSVPPPSLDATEVSLVSLSSESHDGSVARKRTRSRTLKATSSAAPSAS